MCRLASFFHNPSTGDLAVYDITSHSKTEKQLNLNLKIWREGHYLPNGEIECLVTEDDRITQQKCSERLKRQYPTFVKFLNWCGKNNAITSESLDLTGCDLKGVTLPQTVGEWLDLRGCDLKDVTLPQTVGWSLYLSGCDLKDVTLPQTVGWSLYLSGCDLTGVVIPDRFKNKIIK